MIELTDEELEDEFQENMRLEQEVEDADYVPLPDGHTERVENILAERGDQMYADAKAAKARGEF